jgi:hypothetical protein
MAVQHTLTNSQARTKQNPCSQPVHFRHKLANTNTVACTQAVARHHKLRIQQICTSSTQGAPLTCQCLSSARAAVVASLCQGLGHSLCGRHSPGTATCQILLELLGVGSDLLRFHLRSLCGCGRSLCGCGRGLGGCGRRLGSGRRGVLRAGCGTTTAGRGGAGRSRQALQGQMALAAADSTAEWQKPTQNLLSDQPGAPA